MKPSPRVGIISDERYPHTGADTQQVIKNACALAGTGLDVDLVVPRRAGRVWTSRQSRLQEIADYYSIAGSVPVTQLLTVPASDLRFFDKLAHGVAAPLYLTLRRFDVAYTRNIIPALLCLGLGQAVIFETYRLWGHERPLMTSAFARLARHPRFLGVIVHSSFAAQSLTSAGFPADRVEVIYNGFDARDMEPVLTRAQAREMLGLANQRPLVVYAGNMQPNKGVESIVDVAARLHTADFLLVGGVPQHVERLQHYAQSAGAANLTFTGLRPVAEVARYLYAADMLMLPPTARPLATHSGAVLPMKTFSYLAAGRPIVGPDLPDVAEILVNGKNAILVPPDEPDTTATRLGELLQDPSRQERLAAQALETARDLSWEARAERIKTWLIRRMAERGL